MTAVRVLIHEPYPFGKIAGNLRTQGFIIQLVDKQRFNLSLLASFETEFTRQIRDLGIDTIILAPSKRLNRYGGQCLQDSPWERMLSVVDLIRYNLELYRLFVQKKIDVVYCNSIRSILTVGLAANLAGIPVFLYIKGELQNRFLDPLGFVLASRMYFFCKANRDDKYPLLVAIFKKKIGILKIGIDLDEIRNIAKSDKTTLVRELEIISNHINCVYVGQLYPPKGVHFLIEALALVKDEFPQIRLYIVGHHIIDAYKDYHEELSRLIEAKGLKEQVFFTGWRPDALSIVSLMDILIHPSLSEGFGRSVLEGMALGKPVIASRVGGLRELIEEGVNGMLVTPGDPELIASRLRLLMDKALREQLGNKAQQSVFSGYEISGKVKELEQIWSDMAAKK